MTQLDNSLLETREEFRHMLFQYRNYKGLRTNLIASLWLINRIIDIQKATKMAIERTKSKQK